MHVESRGFHIDYEVIGTGPPLLLIPGFLMDRRRWFEVGYVDALMDSHRLVLIDPLGFGGSDKPADPSCYSTADLAADTVAVLDQEGIDSTAVWGYSRGSSLASDLAVLHPGRISHLVAGANPITLPRSLLGRPEVEDYARFLAGDWEAFWAEFPLDLPADVRSTMEARNDPAAAVAAFLGPMEHPDPAQATCPILLYVGGGEWFIDFVRESAELLGCRCEVVGAGGHAETFGSPELIVPIVADFLGESDTAR